MFERAKVSSDVILITIETSIEPSGKKIENYSRNACTITNIWIVT